MFAVFFDTVNHPVSLCCVLSPTHLRLCFIVQHRQFHTKMNYQYLKDEQYIVIKCDIKCWFLYWKLLICFNNTYDSHDTLRFSFRTIQHLLRCVQHQSDILQTVKDIIDNIHNKGWVKLRKCQCQVLRKIFAPVRSNEG